MALHLPIGPLKPISGLEPVPRCELSTYQPISHCAIGTGWASKSAHGYTWFSFCFQIIIMSALSYLWTHVHMAHLPKHTSVLINIPEQEVAQ